MLIKLAVALLVLSSCSKDIECGPGTELVENRCLVVVRNETKGSGSGATVGSGSAVGSIGSSGNEAQPKATGLHAKFEGFRDQMCACKDKTCADRVDEVKMKWIEVIEKDNPAEKLDASQRAQLTEVASKYNKCHFKLLVGSWNCSTRKDAMRGTESQTAMLLAAEPVEVRSDQVMGRLIIRRSPKEDQALITISDGMIDCDECMIPVKFDDQPIRKVYATRSTDYKGLFIGNSAQWIGWLKSAKKLIVELPFYQTRPHQIAFELSPPDCLK